MYFVKSFKDDLFKPNQTTVVFNSKSNLNESKQRPKQKPQNNQNSNPALLDVNIKYFEKGFKMPIQYEDVNRNMSKTGTGFYRSSLNTKEEESNLPDIGSRSPRRDIHTSNSNIKVITQDYV